MLQTIFLSLLAVYESHAAMSDYYTAAVVELASPTYLNYSPDEVMLSNAAIFADYMKNAFLNKVDIIVFPEGGLHGQSLGKSIVLPSPTEMAVPCKDSASFHKSLVLLSCAAKHYNMYAVVNVGERYYNQTSNKTEFYNSNVAFDRNGIVVARYRKFHPYGEPVNKPTLEHETFHTDFGVTFGMFICFDIGFLEPGVVLARDYGVKHFVFPHCWISELPFLTAIQAQWGFAYSLDAVLLASGCNAPALGGSGSGIYHGRRGALEYFQTNDNTSRLIIANVSKSFDYQIKAVSSQENAEICFKEPVKNVLSGEHSHLEVHLLDSQKTNSSLILLRDYTDVYKSQLLLPTGYSPSSGPDIPLQNSSLKVTHITKTTICQDTLCCNFQVRVTTNFNAKPPQAPTRGDDFTRQFYRLVAFDGVRWYGGGLATGGVQICGVVACANESISSCGLRSDDPSAQVAAYGHLYKVGTVFESVSIAGVFSYNKTFIYPDILTTATGNNFGALVSSDIFTYETNPPENGTVLATLTIKSPVADLVTAAIYGRQCDRDGQKRTELPAVSFARPLSQSSFVFYFVFLCLLVFITAFSH